MASETTKAYNNLEFLSSPEARTIRMLSEYIHPIKTFAENKIEGTIQNPSSSTSLLHFSWLF